MEFTPETLKGQLNSVFNIAMLFSTPYIFIGIDAHGVREVIVIPNVSMREKMKYYNGAYNNNLELHANNSVNIVKFQFAHNTEQLEDFMQAVLKS